MNLLSVDTSTESCSAALMCQGDVTERCEIAPQQHAKLILPMIDQLMGDAGLVPTQLDAVVFGRGPGSFTGVRIATALAQGIALAIDRPVVGVSSLAAIAHALYRTAGQENCVALIDARMNQVYAGAYTTEGTGLTRLVGEEAVLDPQHVSVPETGDWLACGSGFNAYRDVFEAMSLNGHLADGEHGDVVFPSAYDCVVLGQVALANGQGVDAADASPVYLRDNVALTEAQRKAGQTL